MMIKRIASWFFGIAFVLIAIVFIGYWWRYERPQKTSLKLPKKAKLLINIDLREVEKTIFWDALYHPMSYWDDSTSDEDDAHKPSKGLHVPAKISFFVLEDYGDILFSQPVPVKENRFAEYVDTLVNQKKWELIDSQFVYDAEKHLFYLWDDDRLGVAFAKRENSDFIQTTILDVLKGKDCLPIPEELLDKINLGEHHFVIWQKQSEWTNNESAMLYGDFEKGSLAIQGEIPFKYGFSERNSYVKDASSSDEVLSFYLNLNDNKFPFSDSFYRNFQKVTHLTLDSLLQYSTGKLSLSVPNIQSKIDSIVTYEYDDDFNKIEKVTTQKILAADIVAQLEGRDSLTLYDYFERRGVIKDINDVSRFVGIPFVEMEATVIGSQLVLSSLSQTDLEEKLDSNFMKLNIGCSQYPQMFDYLPFSLDSAQVNMIDALEFKACQVPNTNQISIKARLKMKNKHRNMLGVLATH